MGAFHCKEAWVRIDKFSISAMVTTREGGDEYTWVLLFTTTIEEGVDGHRYGDTLVLSCPFSFKMKVEGRMTIVRWSRRKLGSCTMVLMVKCQSWTTRSIKVHQCQPRSVMVNDS